MSGLIQDLARAGRLDSPSRAQRVAYYAGALLVLSGLFHVAVYLVDGGPWEGPVSWRKPVVFGLSFGITLATLAWVVGFLRAGKVATWAMTLILVTASVGEVALITMQRWRGVASHFNRDTAFDASVFDLMGMLVTLVVVVTVVVTVWSFVRLDAPPSLRLAIRAGLVLMLVSQMVGVQMIVEGGKTFGAGGALKVPHAVTLHAVQVLPALALLLAVSEVTERHRVRVVAAGAVGYALVIASTMLQTYAGRGPFDPGIAVSLVALAGLALLVGSGLVALRDLTATLHGPAASAPPA
jgi:hypothetical protein